MRRHLASVLLAGSGLGAQVRFQSNPLTVEIDGQPFATFQAGADAGKPYLAPLRAASGTIVTRRFPMETIPGESRDHLHHRGLWFSSDDVNGVKFWENDPSYTKPRMGRIVLLGTKTQEGRTSGSIQAAIEWRDPEGKALLTEDRTMVFPAQRQLRSIDFHITLTAKAEVTIGDTKEGAFAIRLAENFTERRGGRIVNANGLAGMAKVWGQRSAWVDYAGEIEGEKLGVAIFDHPANPHHPTYWHVRDYGLFSLNPFGQNAFDPAAEVRRLKLPVGGKLEFRWRVVIHPGDAESARLADLYREWTATAQPPSPELRVEATDGGSVVRVRNRAAQPLTAFLIELVDYPGSYFALWQDETGAAPLEPGGEKRIAITNMTVGAAPEYVKMQAAVFADGSTAGLPEKAAQLVERRRATLETTRELIRRLAAAQSAGTPKSALLENLRQWADSVPAPTRANRATQAAINQAAAKTLIAETGARLAAQPPGETLAALRASERALAASKPKL